MHAEKRQSHRVSYTSDVNAFDVVPSKSGFIFEVASEPHTFPAMDVSCGGIRLAVSRPLVDQSILKIRMELQKKKPVDVFARVVWTDQKQAGLKFIVVHEEAQRHLAHYTQALA